MTVLVLHQVFVRFSSVAWVAGAELLMYEHTGGICVVVCSGLLAGRVLVLDVGLWPVGRRNIWNCSGHFPGRPCSWRVWEPGILVLGLYQVVGAKRCMQAG
jgi:hypothetical protein